MLRFDREFVADRSDRSLWRAYRKVRTTDMLWIRGPAEVATREGIYTLPESWRGYIAVDSDGYPYPVEFGEHLNAYVLAEKPWRELGEAE
ncbi:MAG TPA: hypothetical protein VFV36_07805 [Candidatus Methylomirabilis sp.]|nr:hypothetical protein [Candidatus Methylomirabilis sp.]